ncbi:MAG TPA: DUF3703 domain-containing protein [Flavobacterium sp.]
MASLRTGAYYWTKISIPAYSSTLKMLLFGIYIKNVKEIFGQISRLIFGGLKSFVGVIPTGNTGGANVPPLKSMKIPTDLQVILERHS